MGKWKETKEFPVACASLASSLADFASLSPGDSLLDVGYGCGDQDLLFWDLYSPSQIVGITSEAAQCGYARGKVSQRNLEDKIRLFQGNATKLSLLKDPCQTFDKIFALDCAYHFHTREAFLNQAFGRLNPNGKVALGDIFLGRKPQTLFEYLLLKFLIWGGKIPEQNMVEEDEYKAQFHRAGFVNLKIEYIEDEVFPGLADFIERQQKDIGYMFKPQISFKFSLVAKGLRMVHQRKLFRFALVVAEKVEKTK